MCLGVPMEVISVDGIAGTCRSAEGTHLIDFSLVGPQAVGTWVLTFLGAAREVIDAGQAAKIADALAGLNALMQGGDLGDAFADLEARSPELPPHLAAAQAAGKPIA